MDILLTFTGFHDPYCKGLLENEEHPGPILSLVSEHSFDKVLLFNTPNTLSQTSATKEALAKLFPDLAVEVVEILLSDPTDYLSILRGLRKHIACLSIAAKCNYFVAVASGTPQMHACWLLLVTSGELPAKILHIRPPRFVTKDSPLVSEVDLTSPEFPIVRSGIMAVDVPELPMINIQIAIREIGIIGDHPKIKKALEMAAMIASSKIPSLILGETGTGKELMARFIHKLSGRSVEKFIPVNCASLPKELFESLLFGHNKGAFTGAIEKQEGKFDLANGGTLFLDELAELSLPVQSKLLRVLQDSIVEPLGAKQGHFVDVRIIAATNQNIFQAVSKGEFRKDLYYRLNAGEIILPSLCDRSSDIPKLALHLLDKINKSIRKPRQLTTEALVKLQLYSWPGNIRELENIIERSVIFSRNEVLTPENIMLPEQNTKITNDISLPEPSQGFSLEAFLKNIHHRLVNRALEIAQGNKSQAAKLLGISPQAVHKFVKNQGKEV